MKNKTLADARETMLEINVRQKDFYESRFEAMHIHNDITERAANAPTNAWSHMRAKLNALRASVGADEQLHQLHEAWMQQLQTASVLDLGCFSGNPLSLWIAEHSAEYTGIDLSEQAIELLNRQLRERQLPHARAYAQDFLANSYPDNTFDLIYAHSVLHHFKDIRILLAEMHRVLKPGGEIISFDPLMTEPLNRLARALYRPLQTDKDWEWPFTLATLRLLQSYFKIIDMRGFLGMAKLGLPVQVLPGCGGLGKAISRWGAKFDASHTRRPGLPFFLCWQATLRMRKPDSR